jgi:hypothetical protein
MPYYYYRKRTQCKKPDSEDLIPDDHACNSLIATHLRVG